MKAKNPDFWIFFLTISIFSFGLVMVFSSSSVIGLKWYKDSTYFLKRQIIWGILGIIGLFFAMNYDYKKYRRFAPLFLFISLFFLGLVLVPGIGKSVSGSRRWFKIGMFTFQPSELAKITLIIYIANYFERIDKEVRNFFNGLLPVLLVIGAVAFLILIEPDMGTALSIVIFSAFMLIVGGVNLLHIFVLFLLSIPVITYFIFSKDYRKDRILAFLDPWKDPLGKGFHIIQSLIALGSGGILGLGLGNSKQKFFYVPGPHTDFIYSIIGEEIGFVGNMILIGGFFFLLVRGIRVALKAPDVFGSLLAFGIIVKIILEALINIGVTLSVFPVTGINLPLVSSGGSSLFFTMISIGILLNISRFYERRAL